jgi:tetratricopeptide (TPR) repeat protein
MSDPQHIAEWENEYESLAEVGAVVATEMQGKLFSGWRPLSAIQTFEGLSALEPRNEDAVFEMGQAYSQLNRTQCAIEQYERLLCINPCHREAKVALDRNYLEMGPQFHLFNRYRSESGRDGLASIDSYAAGALLQFPLGDEDEFLQLGYTRATYDPPGAPQLYGDIATGRVQWKPFWPMLVFGQLDYETYDYGLEPRLNFDVGSRYRYLENAELRLHLQQENVVENRGSILDDVHRYGVEVGNHWQPLFPLEIDTFYRYWEYSDDNAAHEAGVRIGYKLTHGRHQFRWLTALDYMTYRDPAVFFGTGESEMVSHPYFAPRNFLYLSGGLEYRRYLQCDTFKAANLHWFELYGGGGIDSEGSGYGVARGELVRDFSNRLSLSGYFRLTRSGVYDDTEAGSRLTFRF